MLTVRLGIDNLSMCSESSRQNFVVVAGYDYRGIDMSRVDFVKLARNHASVLRNSAEGPVRFTIFDVARGIVQEEIGHGGKIMSARTLAEFHPIQPSYYEVQPSGVPAFRAKGVRTLSILDVYDFITQLGASEPGTLVELAFISHAWGGGPILVNSFDPSPGLSIRHFDDKDARTTKDFSAPNMRASERRLFRSAFCPTIGRIFNFGCADDGAARDVLNQLCRQWHSQHDAARTYDFVFDSRRLSDYRSADPEFFGESPIASRSLAQCQAFLHRRKRASYSQKMADVTGVGCWAAFPGTSSGYEQDGPFPVMSVRKQSTKNEKDAAAYLRLIKLCLGYTEDGMGRGFIQFTPRHTRKSIERVREQSPTAMADLDDTVTALHATRYQLEGPTPL